MPLMGLAKAIYKALFVSEAVVRRLPAEDLQILKVITCMLVRMKNLYNVLENCHQHSYRNNELVLALSKTSAT